MSVTNDWPQVAIDDFLGPWYLLEPTDVPHRYALAAENMEFLPGECLTRTAFDVVGTAGGTISSLDNWVYADSAGGGNISRLVYFDGTYVILAPLDLSSTSVAITGTGATTTRANYVKGNTRLYAAFRNNTGGAQQAQVYNRVNSYSGALFKPPPRDSTDVGSFSFSEGGASSGYTTAGSHNFLIVFRDKGGFQGRPGPVNTVDGLVINTFNFAGNKSVTVTVNPPGGGWPSWVATIQILISTASNLSAWYFLGTELTPATSASAVSYTFLDSDATIRATKTSALSQFGLLTQSPLAASYGTGPFNPIFMSEAGKRMGYVVNDTNYDSSIFFSEPDLYQTLTSDKHIFRLPTGKAITTFFWLQGDIYILGPHWTYATTDTGGLPVNWPAPRLIDSTIGTLAPQGITVNPAGFAFVAAQTGFYVFQGGKFDRLPISYYQSQQWARINWAQSDKLRVVDDKDARRVYVFAALDSATENSHMLTWDYTDGITPESVKFALWYLAGNTTKVRDGVLVDNTLTSARRLELFVVDSIGGVRRKKATTDTTPYTEIVAEGGLSPPSRYDTCLLPGAAARSSVPIYEHHAIRLRMRGSGVVTINTYSLDNQLTQSNTLTVTTSPGKEYLKYLDLINEYVYHSFTNATAAGSYFRLSGLVHYATPYAAVR